MVVAGMKAGLAGNSPLREYSLAWKEIIEPVAPFLDSVTAGLASQVATFDGEISTYAEYALANQGKQLRPVLVALSGGAVGDWNDSLVKVAVIIEMVHLATLVHDDVMDEAEIRRRRPTLAANWGNQLSILLGDCLFAHALKLAASFPTPEICRAVASATKTVCSGEILQTQNRRNLNLGRPEYFKILGMKTAELFALSCDLGAWTVGGSPAVRSALRNYGSALGTAYQLYDDCVDLFGTEESVGKSLGTDLAGGKITLPLLIVLERAMIAEREELQQCLENWHPGFIPRVHELAEKYEAQAESRVVICGFLEEARAALLPVPDNASRNALGTFTEFLAQLTENLGLSS